uniref:Transient receptor potential cation channel, subfamily M, member 2 n=1 Tax=Neogobius melanostomus TaxID=47308 RepID=A0A8C6UEA6_9GOBI
MCLVGCSEDRCRCGYLRSRHVDEAIKPEDHALGSWDINRHVREARTDAFGTICFGGLGHKTAKYVRVSSDTRPEVLYELLTEQWKLTPPNLLISVTGGAKNFYLKARLKNMFHRGLIKVAQTTGAWILTGGTNTGVMKHVGQAVRSYALSSSLNGHIVAIGVATWGIIHNRHTLVNPEGSFPAHYDADAKGQGHLSCLDHNHTHFLLVDNGTHGQYGVEIELRALLEKCISGKKLANQASGVTIPVVCVVLDGGPGTLNTMYNAMLNGTPCVVLEGSGRIADVVANVAELPVSRVTIALIQQLMKKFFGQEYEGFSDAKIIDWTKKIQDIIRMPHLLTVFRVTADSYGDVDVAILRALLKASRSGECLGGESSQRQLELAVAWNRVDIAKTEIFTDESQWKSEQLHKAMFTALVGNKPDFVSLLLENGVSLRDFLQKETLCDLYKLLPNCLFLRRLAKRASTSQNLSRSPFKMHPRAISTQSQTISLSHVSVEVRRLLGSFTQHIYPPSATVYNLDTSTASDSVKESPDPQTNPERDLFLWAIIHNNKELAEIFWEECQDCMAAALAASKILKKLAEEGHDADEGEEMIKLAKHYEKRAMDVFSECYSCDEERAQKLLVRVSPFWGRTTCLRMALEADTQKFVAQSGVQGLLTQIWCGELSVENPVWRVLVCIIFCPLIYMPFLDYRRDEAIQREAEKKEEINTIESITGSVMYKSHSLGELSEEMQAKPLNGWMRLVSLYSSPQVKFYMNIVSYFGFLALFAVVLIVDFQPAPSGSEILLYIWIFSLVCEEIRQLFYDPDGFGFHKKAKMYINDLWNILDVLSIVLFIIGLGFRLDDTLFYAGKIVLCIDFMVFCLRLMAIFTISRTLGPKIIIVKRMMLDMFFFMFLLSIWVVAYGVAKQGILIHNEDRLGWILRGAVYEPYLTIFGDVPKNIDNTEFDISACSMNGSDPLKPKCPVLNEDEMPAFPEWLTIIMLCVYLLFANILLLNLLIAIFNFTFQEVQDNTDRIWKFQRYELIKEYHSRPAAPPPFILLSHLYMFLRSVLLRRPAKQELSGAEEEELLSWEALMKDKYLMSTKQEQLHSTERRIQDTAQKVSTLCDRLDRDEDPSSGSALKRLARLEEQVLQSAKALQWIMDSLKSPGVPAKDAPSLNVTLPDDSTDSSTNPAEKDEFFHVKARQLHYPDSRVTRFPVPEEKVPWEVSFSSYCPLYYTSSDTGDSTDGNPAGRTGLRGRGVLPRLGPNCSLDLILTRLNIHQVLCAFDVIYKHKYQLLFLISFQVFEVYKGYVDDHRNTDDAWVETTVLNLHLDRDSPLLTDINRMVTAGPASCLTRLWDISAWGSL